MGVIPIKKILICFVLIFSLLLISSVYSQNIDLNKKTKDEFIFDGETLSYSFTPVIINKIKFIPLNSFCNMLSGDIATDAVTKLLTIKNNFIDLKLKVNSNIALLNDVETYMGGYLLKRNGIIYIPLEFSANITSQLISWDIEKGMAIASPGKSWGDNPQFNPSETITDAKSKPVSDIPVNTGKLILVNKWNTLSPGYVPGTLIGVMDNGNQYNIPSKLSYTKMDSEATKSMSVMLKAAKASGCSDFIVSSGYRAYSLQNFYYTKKINFFLKAFKLTDAQKKAAEVVAPPGMSEHQTGLAADMTNRDLLRTSEPLVEGFSNTKQGKWLSSNSWKYGYVIRYKTDKTKFTGIISEPWHIRFVGLPHAEIMSKNNLCLEEYLEYIKRTKYLSFKAINNKLYEIYYLSIEPSISSLRLLADNKSIIDISNYGKSGYIITKVTG